MIDSDIAIERNPEYTDCYSIAIYNGQVVTVSATLLSVLAEAVDTRGEQNILPILQHARDL